jgi:uncharacterized protein (DUF1697 family)
VAQFFAFLRGINVGGRNRLAMKRLAGLFEEAGARDVSTYIQSGNVIFGVTRAGDEKRVTAEVEARLLTEDGIRSPIITRSSAALKNALEEHPFVNDERDERMLSIGFFSRRPKPTLVKSLQPDRSPPDRFYVSGTELFLHTPLGMGKTKLTTDYFDRQLEVVTTVRNLKTIRALVALIAD